MNTTTLSIDKGIKERVAVRARKERLSVSSVARILLSDYADGRISIGAHETGDIEHFMIREVSVDSETQNKMDRLARKWEKMDA